MRDLIFQLKVNGTVKGKVTAKPGTPKTEFVNYVKGIAPEFDETKDTLEIEDITPAEPNKVMRHKARDKSQHNKYVDAILSRHLSNLIATYGEAKVLKLIAEVHGLVKSEKKAG